MMSAPFVVRPYMLCMRRCPLATRNTDITNGGFDAEHPLDKKPVTHFPPSHVGDLCLNECRGPRDA